MTQAQVGFSAHSASQLHAPLALAFSSQYQPDGQIPLPHLLQVPSSQLGPLESSGSAAAALDGSCSRLSLLAEPWLEASGARLFVSAGDCGSPPVVVPPPH